MTLKRLAILLLVPMLLAGVGIAWLWQYGYTPQGRARNIIAQFNGDTTSTRAWCLKHGLIKPVVFDVPPGGRVDLAAAEALADIGPDALPAILEFLKDGNPDVRRVAVIVCGMIRDPRAAEPLALCLHDSNDRVKVCSVRALGELGPKGAKYLQEAFNDGSLIGPPKEWEGYWAMRRELPDALVKALGRQALPALMEMLQKGDSPVVLGRIPAAIGRCAGEKDLPKLLELLKQEDIRWLVIQVLGELKDKRAVDSLLPYLSNDPSNFSVAHSAAWALGEIGDTKAVPALLKPIFDSSSLRKRVECRKTPRFSHF